MMRPIFLFILNCTIVTSAFAATWIEDSLGFAFEYPRGWNKAVQRFRETARIQFSKTNRDAIMQIDVARRTKEYDLDRFIEETVDVFLQKYPDLKVVREKPLSMEAAGFDESTFLVLHYTENKVLVTNRFLFHRSAGIYYAIQTKTSRSHYAKYGKEMDAVLKSFRKELRPKTRWRNDSLAYLDPIREEKLIQTISITQRPMDSYPQSPGRKKEDGWLFSVEGNEKPNLVDWDKETKVTKVPEDTRYSPEDVKPETPTTDTPIVLPDPVPVSP